MVRKIEQKTSELLLNEVNLNLNNTLRMNQKPSWLFERSQGKDKYKTIQIRSQE
ncbi:MAG: hypothetical protein J0H87_02360 [Holosporales bacterium]|nr:hypothetical protein [Holosporales bacterium]